MTGLGQVLLASHVKVYVCLQVKVLNRALDLSHWYLLSARVMLTQHTAALHALHSSNQPRQHKQAGHLHLYEAHQPQQYPPHLPYLTQNLVLRHAPVRRLIENATEDCRAFCIEKNSAAPDVEIVGGENLRATVLDAYVSFVFTEIMKNAMQVPGVWYDSITNAMLWACLCYPCNS